VEGERGGIDYPDGFDALQPVRREVQGNIDDIIGAGRMGRNDEPAHGLTFSRNGIQKFGSHEKNE